MPALAHPQGLWLLALLAPLIALYILKVRRERVMVASTWLWQAAARDMLARRPWQRLRGRVLLLLEALAIAALALALARPTWSGAELHAEHVALVLDVSASMQAQQLVNSEPVDGRRDKTRFALGVQQAERVLSALSPGADVLLIEAGTEPRVVGPPDRDLTRIKTRLRQLNALGVEGHLDRAIVLASEQLGQRSGDRRIVVISDPEGLATPLPQTKVPVSVVKVGEPTDNAGLVRVDIRRGQASGSSDRVEVFSEVDNFGEKPRDLFVTLKLRNSPTVLASRKLRLEPGQKAPVVLGFDAAPTDAGAGLVVELAPHDALPVDDSAFGRVPPSRKLSVVTSPPHQNAWFERALLADPDVELLGAPLAELATSGIDDDALLVVTGACPAYLPGADFVLLNPPPGPCRGAVVGKSVEGPTITSWERTDPRLRFITLDGVSIAKAHLVDPLSAQGVLVRGREGPLIVDVSQGGRTGTLLGFDVGESNWPLRASFVLFVRDLAELARAHRLSRVVGPARTGAPLRLRVPPDIEEATLTDPKSRESKLAVHGGIAVVPSPEEPGFYLLTYAGQHPGTLLSVVNLTSPTESDLRRHAAGPELAGSAKPSHGDVAEPPDDWGFLAALAALVAIVLQVLWLTRKPAAVDPSKIRPVRPARGVAA